MKKRMRIFCFAVCMFMGGLLALYGMARMSANPILGKSCLPEPFRLKPHNDYPWGLRWVPRWATSWCMQEPPVQLLGNQKSTAVTPAGKRGPKPIPEPGTWQLSGMRLHINFPIYIPTYVAITTKNRFHFRIGARWDDVDHYYVFPSIALKKVLK